MWEVVRRAGWRAREWLEQHRVYWHGQNLTADLAKKTKPRWMLFAGRGWLWLRGLEISAEWHLGPYSTLTHVLLRIDPDEREITVSVALWWVATVFVSLGGNWLRRILPGEPREVSVRWFEGTLCYGIWTHPDAYQHRLSLRGGRIHVLDALFGSVHLERRAVQETTAKLDLPEGSYPVRVTIEQRTWGRPRLPFRSRGKWADMLALVAVPIPPRGQESYDPPMDALYAVSCCAGTVQDALAKFKESVLDTRLQRSGSREWLPSAVVATADPGDSPLGDSRAGSVARD